MMLYTHSRLRSTRAERWQFSCKLLSTYNTYGDCDIAVLAAMLKGKEM